MGTAASLCWLVSQKKIKERSTPGAIERSEKRNESPPGRVAFSKKGTVFRQFRSLLTPSDTQCELFEVSCLSFVCPSFLFCRKTLIILPHVLWRWMNNQGLPQRMNALKCKVRSGDEYLSLGSGRDMLKFRISVLAT